MASRDDSADVEALHQRWTAHLDGLRARQEAIDAAFGDLARCYAEPHRAYHNLQHISQVLDVIDYLESRVVDLRAVRMAAWFHDVVYDPRGQENEARSAVFAREALRDLGYAPTSPVEAMILATREHSHSGADLDTLVLLDADLAILGAPAEVYQEYAAAIRKEYFWVPEARFYSGRSEVLRKLLSRTNTFALPEMREQFEAQARANMGAELASLQ